MDATKQPGIICKGILLKACRFEREPEVAPQPIIVPEFKYGYGLTEDGREVHCRLEAWIHYKDGSSEKHLASIYVDYMGLFEQASGQENLSLEDFARQSGAGIIFPFVRQKVYDLSMSAAIQPVLLPPVNLRAMLKYDDN